MGGPREKNFLQIGQIFYLLNSSHNDNVRCSSGNSKNTGTEVDRTHRGSADFQDNPLDFFSFFFSSIFTIVPLKFSRTKSQTLYPGIKSHDFLYKQTEVCTFINKHITLQMHYTHPHKPTRTNTPHEHNNNLKHIIFVVHGKKENRVVLNRHSKLLSITVVLTLSEEK
jgi:hypothetical protein